MPRMAMLTKWNMWAISSSRSAYESLSKYDGGGTEERLLLFVSVPELFVGIAPLSASVVQPPTFAYSSTTSCGASKKIRTLSPMATSGVAVVTECRESAASTAATDDVVENNLPILLLLLLFFLLKLSLRSVFDEALRPRWSASFRSCADDALKG